MSEPHSDRTSQDNKRNFLHGRRVRPLLTPLIACLIVAGLIYFFETQMPAFHDVVKIGYFAIAVVLVIATARAFRTRERSSRRGERRQGDRRRNSE